MSVIASGTPAPNFKLATEDGGSFTGKDLKGERTVLVFYPFAFSPVCTDQLQLYEAALGELPSQGVTKLYGVSCDSSWSQKAFREKLGVSIEQLSDFEPKGAACKAFGVLHEGGFPERALVAIDAEADRALELSGADAGRAAQRRAAARGRGHRLRRCHSA